MVAAAVIGGAVIGAAGSAYAGSQQSSAAKNAQNISQNQYANTVALESPYNQTGYGAISQLNYLEGLGTPGKGQTDSSSTYGGFGSLNTPFTAANFKQLSPAYQFQFQQGQQNVLNGDASGQGALSGAALKDLVSYNQGMANTSFNNAFNQYQTQNQNIYGRLSNLANLGQSAASGTAQAGTALAGQAAQSAQNYGTAQAGGTVGATNALGNGISNGAIWAQYGGNPYPYGNSGTNPENISGLGP